MNKEKSVKSFETDPIPKVVIQNALPALIAMIMVIVYNLADTFFIGLTKNDYQIAAVSYGAPIFMVFMSLGTLFGVGGTSVISRAMGKKDYQRAKSTASFCTWASIGVGVLLTAIILIFTEQIALSLGSGAETLEDTVTYLRITALCGAFSMASNCHSNILRAEGQAMKAMTGTLIGNLLNMILDAVFILGFKMGVAGAAVATVIGNVVAALYYILFFLKGKTELSISLKDFSMKDKIFREVVAIGISASLANLLSSLAAIIVNKQMSPFGDIYVASYGVTSKVIIIVSMIGIGIGAGVQPILGYCVGAKLKERFRGYLKFSTFFATGLCLLISIICFFASDALVKVFLTDTNAWETGSHFTKILMSTAWFIGPFVVVQNTLQAMGHAVSALASSLIRQAILFIPAVFIMKILLGMDGLIWAQPVADVISIFVNLALLLWAVRKFDISVSSQSEIETMKETENQVE